jgi:hypothetical protein
MANVIGNVDLGKGSVEGSGVTRENFVDFNYLGKQISKAITTRNTKLAAEDAAIEKQMNDLQAQLDKQQQLAANSGDLVKGRALEYAQNASAQMLVYSNLFKAGKMKPQQYLTAKNNVQAGADNMDVLFKKIDDTRLEFIERQKIDATTGMSKGQDLEAFLGEQIQGFQDLRDNKVWIGNDGMTYFGKIDASGKLSQNPADYRTVTGAISQIDTRYDNFDTDTDTTNVADAVDEVIKAFPAGRYKTVSDAYKNDKKVREYVADQFQQAATNPYNVTSMVKDQIGRAPNGKDYEYTYDAQLASQAGNEHLIVLKKNVNGKFDGVDESHPNWDKQKKVAEEFYVTQVQAKLGRKETARDYKAPSAAEIKAKGEKAQGQADFKTLANLFANPTVDGKLDFSEIDVAINALSGLGFSDDAGTSNRVLKAERTNDGVRVFREVTRKDGTTDTEDQFFEFGENSNNIDFARKIFPYVFGRNPKDEEIAQVERLTKVDTFFDKEDPSASRKFSGGRKVVKSKPFTELKQTMGDNIDVQTPFNQELDIDDDMPDALRKLNKQFSGGLDTDISFSGFEVGEDVELNDGTKVGVINFEYDGSKYQIPLEFAGTGILSSDNVVPNGFTNYIEYIYNKMAEGERITQRDLRTKASNKVKSFYDTQRVKIQPGKQRQGGTTPTANTNVDMG